MAKRAPIARPITMCREPSVMLVPLIVMAVGEVFAGWLYYDAFVGEHMEAFWGASILFAEGNEVPHHAHEVPLWVKLSPLVVDIAGIAGLRLLHVQARIPGYLAWRWAGCTASCSTSGFRRAVRGHFVEPAKNSVRPVEGWRWQDHRRPRPRWHCQRFAGRRQAGDQTGVRLRYHFAFAMLIGVVILITCTCSAAVVVRSS